MSYIFVPWGKLNANVDSHAFFSLAFSKYCKSNSSKVQPLVGPVQWEKTIAWQRCTLPSTIAVLCEKFWQSACSYHRMVVLCNRNLLNSECCLYKVAKIRRVIQGSEQLAIQILQYPSKVQNLTLQKMYGNLMHLFSFGLICLQDNMSYHYGSYCGHT